MGERIKAIRKALGLTQQKFGERIGVKGNTIAQYELGRNEPVDSVLSLLCREFNVSEEWLRTGQGEMFKQLSQAELAARTVGEALSSDNKFIQTGKIDTCRMAACGKICNKCRRRTEKRFPKLKIAALLRLFFLRLLCAISTPILQ